MFCISINNHTIRKVLLIYFFLSKFVRCIFLSTFTALFEPKVRKMLKRHIRILSMIIVISSFVMATITSCGGSRSSCLYNASSYQKKSKSKRGPTAIYKPKPYKHQQSMRKKWIINDRRRSILGHK